MSWFRRKPEPETTFFVRYCEDCRWYRPADKHTDPAAAIRFAECASPRLGLDDARKHPEILVSRSVRPESQYCSVKRGSYGDLDTCGPKGAWFEPKEAA